MSARRSHWPLLVLVLLYGEMGFFASSLNILIPYVKQTHALSQGESQLLALVYSLAMVTVSIGYKLFLSIARRDPIELAGPRRFILLGIGATLAGVVTVYASLGYDSFGGLLIGVFLAALGATMQLVVGNPLILALGPADSGAQRLSIASGVNNFATMVSPVVISLALFGVASGGSVGDAGGLRKVYLGLGLFSLLIAGAVGTTRWRERTPHLSVRDLGSSSPSRDSASIWRQPQFTWGLPAMFAYVGVETSTISNLPELLRQQMNVPTSEVAPYLSLFKTGLMAGKWMVAATLLAATALLRGVAAIAAVIIAFVLFFFVNGWAGYDVAAFVGYLPVVAALPLAYVFSTGNNLRMLALFSALGLVAVLVAMASDGRVSAYAFASVGLFCSVLWPCVFAQSTRGLGDRTSEASSWLVMTFVGGGVVSWAQGHLADDGLLGIKGSYSVVVACFAYLNVYAAKLVVLSRRSTRAASAVSHGLNRRGCPRRRDRG